MMTSIDGDTTKRRNTKYVSIAFNQIIKTRKLDFLKTHPLAPSVKFHVGQYQMCVHRRRSEDTGLEPKEKESLPEIKRT